MGRTRPKCNEDCFNCIFEDCIVDKTVTNSEKRAREAAHKKQYYEANKEAFSIRMKEYYQLHKEQIKARQRAYYWKNREKISRRRKQQKIDRIANEVNQERMK